MQIFDGKTLKGWDGAPTCGTWKMGRRWRIQSRTSFWHDEHHLARRRAGELRIEGGDETRGLRRKRWDSVPQPKFSPPTEKARARKYAKWDLRGYQADFDYGNQYTGQLYEQGTGRGIIAWRGQMVETDQGKRPRLLATLGTSDELKAFIKPGEWNQYEVIADGNTLIHIINGHVMAILVDNDPTFSQSKGLIGFEIEGGGVVKISHRNIWLKEPTLAQGPSSAADIV